MSGVLARYDALVAAQELKPDPDQRRAAGRLEALATALQAVPRRGSVLWRMLGKVPEAPRGVYLWGGVGRGKSMLVDLFFSAAAIEAKRRVHFHEFMLEVHERLRAVRERQESDPIAPVAHDLAREAKLLVFDEIIVNNMADAAVLGRLFAHLFENGVTLVATSNRQPADLYKDGLNRELFLPFIALIEARLDVLPLDGPVDYRLQRLGGSPTWYAPLGEAATKAASAAFFRLTDYPPEDRAHVPACDIAVPGARTMHVPKALKGVAVFSFKRLCGEARGAADYLAIARAFHTVIVVGIPVMGPELRNEAARFTTLIDELYEHNVKLLAVAAADPMKLYPEGDGAFEFQRTVSRLIEMQSASYLSRGHGSAGGAPR